MARVFIVEDEEIILERIIILLEEMEHQVAGYSKNADEAFDVLKNSNADLVILDIALPGKNNGISIAKQINEQLNLPVIFTSSYQDKETIGEAAQTNPVTYLTKPIQKGDLLAAIELALHQKHPVEITEQREKNIFYTKIGDKLSKIEASSILWIIAADSNYCDLVLSDGRKISLRSSMSKLLKQLPPNMFIQTHRQYIVKLSAVENINLKEQSVYIGNNAIPIGRRYKDEFMKRIERI